MDENNNNQIVEPPNKANILITPQISESSNRDQSVIDDYSVSGQQYSDPENNPNATHEASQSFSNNNNIVSLNSNKEDIELEEEEERLECECESFSLCNCRWWSTKRDSALAIRLFLVFSLAFRAEIPGELSYRGGLPTNAFNCCE